MYVSIPDELGSLSKVHGPASMIIKMDPRSQFEDPEGAAASSKGDEIHFKFGATNSVLESDKQAIFRQASFLFI